MEKKTTNNLGTHLIIDMEGVSSKLLNNLQLLETVLVEAARSSNMTVLGVKSHQFSPQGVTAIVLLEESHISIHTYPELQYAAIDIFTCGDKAKPDTALEYIDGILCPRRTSIARIPRGLY
jgi:S-adenosylmethionine decarboxylase